MKCAAIKITESLKLVNRERPVHADRRTQKYTQRSIMRGVAKVSLGDLIYCGQWGSTITQTTDQFIQPTESVNH